jgi:hypothetical protein
MNRISSTGVAQEDWAVPPPTVPLEADLARVFPILDHPGDGGWEGRFDAADLWPDWTAADGGAAPSKVELCLRFACMMSGGILLAAGLVSGLSLGLFASPLFGFAGLGAAALGAALCAGGFVIGRRNGQEYSRTKTSAM